MASFLLSECLENIFSYLDEVNEPFSNTSTSKYKDLYSCTLVSRHWCRISTPFLYAYPFHSYNYYDYEEKLNQISMEYNNTITSE